MASLGSVTATCPLCERNIDVPLTQVSKERPAGGEVMVIVQAHVDHCCEEGLQALDARLADGWVPPSRPVEDIVAEMRAATTDTGSTP